MKQLQLLCILATLLFAENIKPNNPLIYISGSHYTKSSDTLVDFHRHSDSLLAMEKWLSKFDPLRAKTTSGVTVSIKTNAPTIEAHFRILPGENRWGAFAVEVQGEVIQTEQFNPTKDSSITIIMSNPNTAESTVYTITLPNWGNVGFTGLTLPDGYALFPIEDREKSVYVAYGNSITHGTGQEGTHEIYPYLLAKKMGWELTSIAVGGAKTSLTLAEMLRNDFDTIDYMTILIGYNDYNGEGIDTTEYRSRYESILSAIRERHGKTKIFCISPTYTTTTTSVKSGIPIDDFRRTVQRTVSDRQATGDSLLYLIRGEELTTSNDLSDAVHLNTAGAANLADSLYNQIKVLLQTANLPTQQTRTTSPLHILQKENLLIVGNRHHTKRVSLYSTRGRIIQTESGNTLKLHNLSCGTYIIEAKTTTTVIRQRVLIR